jgi:hypothetical protein
MQDIFIVHVILPVIVREAHSFLPAPLILADVLFPPFFSVRCMLHLGETEVEKRMTTKPGWQELFQAAMLEVLPEELPQRIAAAEEAIRQRSEALDGSSSCSSEEQQAIADALRALRVLAQTECQASGSRPSGIPRSEVAL